MQNPPKHQKLSFRRDRKNDLVEGKEKKGQQTPSENAGV